MDWDTFSSSCTARREYTLVEKNWNKCSLHYNLPLSKLTNHLIGQTVWALVFESLFPGSRTSYVSIIRLKWMDTSERFCQYFAKGDSFCGWSYLPYILNFAKMGLPLKESTCKILTFLLTSKYQLNDSFSAHDLTVHSHPSIVSIWLFMFKGM